MSWQCPICETVNQDVTPVCTVCDSLAPVIESFLSLESIEDLREYNEKLDEIHRLEIEGNYEKMLKIALEAIAIYKENGLAVEKAKQALKRKNEALLTSELISLLHSTIENKNYLAATAIIRLIDNFNLEVPELSSLKSEVRTQLSRETEIDRILKESYKAIISLELNNALELVESGLEKYSSSKLLQYRRDEIKSFAASLNKLKKKAEVKKKPYPKLVHSPEIENEKSHPLPTEVISLDTKRKFPKPKRK